MQTCTTRRDFGVARKLENEHLGPSRYLSGHGGANIIEVGADQLAALKTVAETAAFAAPDGSLGHDKRAPGVRIGTGGVSIAACDERRFVRFGTSGAQDC